VSNNERVKSPPAQDPFKDEMRQMELNKNLKELEDMLTDRIENLKKLHDNQLQAHKDDLSKVRKSVESCNQLVSET